LIDKKFTYGFVQQYIPDSKIIAGTIKPGIISNGIRFLKYIIFIEHGQKQLIQRKNDQLR